MCSNLRNVSLDRFKWFNVIIRVLSTLTGMGVGVSAITYHWVRLYRRRALAYKEGVVYSLLPHDVQTGKMLTAVRTVSKIVQPPRRPPSKNSDPKPVSSTERSE